MPSRAAIRWLLWAACWGFALLASRPALAVAPMCDERGASAIAPTPVLPARDVKIDAGTPLGCDSTTLVMAAPGWQARPHRVAVEEGSNEAWVRPTSDGISRPTSGSSLGSAATALPVSAEHGRGVFRPPRS